MKNFAKRNSENRMQNGFNNITKEQFLILESFNKVRTENIFNQSLDNL